MAYLFLLGRYFKIVYHSPLRVKSGAVHRSKNQSVDNSVQDSSWIQT